MLYDDAETFRVDLERSLEVRADGDQSRLDLLHRDAAFDRLLARVVAAVPGRWSLSGERALTLRFPGRPRTGWNLDIDWPHDGYEDLEDFPSLVTGYEAGDFFEVMVEERGGSAGRRAWRRFNVDVSLAGRHFSSVSLTLRLQSAPLPIESLLCENTLGFAGLPCVTVATVLLEMQAAEMLLSHVSECARRLVPANLNEIRDLAMVATQSGLDADILGAVLHLVFARQGMKLPRRLPDPFGGWSELMRQTAAMSGHPTDYLLGYEGVVALFNPVLSGEIVEGTWDAARRSWQAPGSKDEGYVPPL